MNWETAGYVFLIVMAVCSGYCLVRGAIVAERRKRAEGKE